MYVARRDNLRARVLDSRFKEDGEIVVPPCDGCGETPAPMVKWFVHKPDNGTPGTTANARLLCSYCHSDDAIRKARRNHPDIGPGWLAKRIAERAAQGLPKRKPGKRQPREILMDPALLDFVNVKNPKKRRS